MTLFVFGQAIIRVFLSWINNEIQFTIEKETNKSLNFLDLTISTENNEITFEILKKPTQSGVIMPVFSNQSSQIKHSVFHSLIFED